MLIIRQLNTYVTSLHKDGFIDILILYDVYMTREVNSSDRIFNGYWKSLASRMYAQPAKIRNLMLSVCVFLASGYNWATVMHEISISSAQTMTSFHALELSSTIPLVPLERGLIPMRRFQRVCSI
jgi:hypothetical protein